MPDCNTIRRKINELLLSGSVTQTGFCDIINVGAPSFQLFIKKSGKDNGTGSNVYWKSIVSPCPCAAPAPTTTVAQPQPAAS